MPFPLIAAGIAAAASVGGAWLSSKATKKAANKSADAARETAAQNNALQQGIYNQNLTNLSPFMARGNEAGSAINALLGLGGQQTTAQYGPATPIADPQDRERWANGALQAMNLGSRGNSYDTLQAHLAGQIEGPMQDYRMNAYNAYRQANPETPQTTAQAGAAVAPAQNAFQNYLGSTGYQFQVDQGNKAINQGYAAKGSLQSGAALKALQTYGQNTATGFFKDYLGLLSNQQGVGLAGASAVAGVGQNYANNVSANNNNATAQRIDAYGRKAGASSDLYGAIAGGISGMANAYGSSYRRPAA